QRARELTAWLDGRLAADRRAPALLVPAYAAARVALPDPALGRGRRGAPTLERRDRRAARDDRDPDLQPRVDAGPRGRLGSEPDAPQPGDRHLRQRLD